MLLAFCCNSHGRLTYGSKTFGCRRVVKIARVSCRAEQSVATQRWKKVYLGTSPLIGFELVDEVIPGALQLHHFIALKSDSNQFWILDFVPLNPTSPLTAITLASGGTATGQIRSKLMPRLTSGRTITLREIGELALSEGQEVESFIESFNRSWNIQLKLFSNDCTHYCNTLLPILTGKNGAITSDV
ncbi:hypothetical protein CEUSTIGMA_g11427.t1 [Chlamydomonas eustigma]|uniref:Uncharacterized protein n=1 Tax=Chlamydomonas eustigma TaxID=1157962 RepID=A0A250XM80_9CHLO|nr:hypothetical protein CEUSTIGMA_g11427.t1 [Chlamydomonas eustigma]|eukprot:GAX84002.1 hypothetical protein CEUSTIGMA_g11427.t1 [Chlamydomonas eustigma]